MQEQKDTSGKIFLDGKDLDQPGGFELVVNNIQELLKQLKNRRMSIYSISMELTFVDTSNESYEQNDNPMEIHTDSNDLSRMFDFDDVQNDNYREFLQFLESHVYDYMKEDTFVEFSKKFMELYGKVEFLLDAVVEGFDPTDYMDLDLLLRLNMISYRIRKVCGKYQLVHERRRINVA